MKHIHRPITRGPAYCYTRCVNPNRCEPGAHGNVTFLDTCRCGASRSVNINQHWIERGPWSEPKDVNP